MATPVWSPGTLYLPGALVRPLTGSEPVVTALNNPGFDAGSLTGWTFTNVGGVAVGTLVTLNPQAGTWNLSFTGGAGSGFGGGIELIGENTVYPNATPGLSITASMFVRLSSNGVSAGRVRLFWYTAGNVLISVSDGNLVQKPGNNSETWVLSTVTGIAPATTAKVKVGFWCAANGPGDVRVDSLSWNYTASATPAGLIYRAVQAAAGTSDNVEPVWPLVLASTVVDNTVTWEAVLGNRVVWQAEPIMVSGASQPVWPVTVGARITDNTISWETVSRRIEDENCPNTKVVAIISSKVFAADGDIVRFSATANPKDWTSEKDAGYLPTGLQQANANDLAVLQPYRANLAAFNASSFQAWQVDPNPEAMAILDQMDGVGSTYQRAAQSVGNELFYLSQLGVRTVGIANAAENLQAGDVGMPIDPLVQPAVRVAAGQNKEPLATYYPAAGQYWLTFRNFPPSVVAIFGDVPNSGIGMPVNYQYTITGGVPPYSASILSGSLPPGASISASGRVTGTYTTIGSYSWVVQVFDSVGGVGGYATLADSNVISAVPTITNNISGAAPDWSVGSPYPGYQYVITPAAAPIATVAVVEGALPTGLSMSNAGLIDTGTPTVQGTFGFTPRVTDTAGLYSQVNDSVDIIAGAFYFADVAAAPTSVSYSITGASNDGTIATGIAGAITRIHSCGGRLFVFEENTGLGRTWNGTTWASVTGLGSGVGAINGMCFDSVNNVWIAVLQSASFIYRSTNGIAFTGVAVGAASRFCAAAKGGVILTGKTNGDVDRSTDAGLTWATVSVEPLGGSIESLVATASGFTASNAAVYAVRTSPAGVTGTWTASSFTPLNGLLGVNGSLQIHVEIVAGTVRYSSNNWVTHAAGVTVPAVETRNAIISSNGAKFLVPGNANKVTVGTGTGTWTDMTGIANGQYVGAVFTP